MLRPLYPPGQYPLNRSLEWSFLPGIEPWDVHALPYYCHVCKEPCKEQVQNCKYAGGENVWQGQSMGLAATVVVQFDDNAKIHTYLLQMCSLMLGYIEKLRYDLGLL
jgi:hypothetical protein